MSKLYPPVLKGALAPLYHTYSSSDENAASNMITAEISFNMNRAVSLNLVQSFILRFKSVVTGKTVRVKEYSVSYLSDDDKIALNSGKSAGISFGNIAINPEDDNSDGSKFIIGTFYKVLIAYRDLSGVVGYYSNAGITKYIGSVPIAIVDFLSSYATVTYIPDDDDTTEKMYSVTFNIDKVINKNTTIPYLKQTILHNSENDSADDLSQTELWNYGEILNGKYKLSMVVTTTNGLSLVWFYLKTGNINGISPEATNEIEKEFKIQLVSTGTKDPINTWVPITGLTYYLDNGDAPLGERDKAGEIVKTDWLFKNTRIGLEDDQRQVIADILDKAIGNILNYLLVQCPYGYKFKYPYFIYYKYNSNTNTYIKNENISSENNQFLPDYIMNIQEVTNFKRNHIYYNCKNDYVYEHPLTYYSEVTYYALVNENYQPASNVTEENYSNYYIQTLPLVYNTSMEDIDFYYKNGGKYNKYSSVHNILDGTNVYVKYSGQPDIYKKVYFEIEPDEEMIYIDISPVIYYLRNGVGDYVPADILFPSASDLYYLGLTYANPGYTVSFDKNYDDGCIDFALGVPKEQSKTILNLIRAEWYNNDTEYAKLYDLGQITIDTSNTNDNIVILYKDLGIEAGKKYNYIVCPWNSLIGYVTGSSVSPTITAVRPYFEDIFLTDLDSSRLLKISYNSKVNSFRDTILEQKIDTIGGRYPMFFRNGAVKYKEILLNGLISYHSDESGLFQSTIIPKKNTAEWSTSLTDENIYAERFFRQEVLEWLLNGKPKMLRSPTEGNIVLRLTNVTLSPELELGRMLYSFTATGYEVCDVLDFHIPLLNITSSGTNIDSDINNSLVILT